MNWLQKNGFYELAWYLRYLNAIYFAFITMITVGFGDITPTNAVEKLFVIVFTTISCGVFAYVVNTIGSIFGEIAKKNQEFKMKKNEVTEYMRQRGIQNNIQVEVIKYLEYTQKREKEE